MRLVIHHDPLFWMMSCVRVFSHGWPGMFQEGAAAWLEIGRLGVPILKAGVIYYMLTQRMTTPRKTNMATENGPLEKEKHLQITNFWVPAVCFPGSKP